MFASQQFRALSVLTSRFRAASLVSGAALAIAACSGDDQGSTGDAANSQSTTQDSASQEVASGQPSSGGDGAEQSPGGAAGSESTDIDDSGELLVDDLEDGDDKFTLRGLEGEWFTYSDGTAEVSPPSHMGIGDEPGQVRVSGSGFSEWGVAVAAYFQYSDLSEFKGVKVRIKGTGTVRFELSTEDTLPLDHDGVCESGCYGHYAKNIELPADYEDVVILFEDLDQPGWANQAPLSLERAGQVDFLMPGSASEPATIDLWIDSLSLIAADGCRLRFA